MSETEAVWAEVDSYFVERLIPGDPVLEEALAAAQKAGLPSIAVSPAHGQMLNLFARMAGAKRILEIGTLGGYSTICLARALPADGRLVTLELDQRHADVARANFERAGLSQKIDLRVGRAVASLAQLDAEGTAPFDLVFIDADKESNPDYLAWALRLSRPGTVIICDNVVRHGRVIDAETTDPAIIGVRRFIDLAGSDLRLSATAVQTVGAKGYDGFALLLVE